mmetsp:Transcript_7091/g.14242  ORF Transcript_7091/g.14242 Transcript_7091/m.14242 type:complete len:364 (-) Transcript_7091:119-1210(-)
MISIQQILFYAVIGAATIILLSSSIDIGVAIVGKALSSPTMTIDFDVDFDQHDDATTETETVDTDPILPITARKLALARGETVVSDVLPKLLQMSSETRKINESELPYSCGAVLFYHIPGTGGKAIRDWLKKLVEAHEEIATFFSSEGLDYAGFASGVDAQIQSIGSNNWKFIYAHDNSIVLGDDSHRLNQWRDVVASQKCRFLLTTTFQDPMDHSVSHTKKEFAKCNCEMEIFKSFVQKLVEFKPWRGQLDYLLYNTDESRIEHSSMDQKGKVKKGLRLLKNQFDVVVIDDHNKYADTILKVTGWPSPAEIPQKVLSDSRDLVFTKEMVSSWGKMSSKNGDADFIDAVNHVFFNSLGYLMEQ